VDYRGAKDIKENIEQTKVDFRGVIANSLNRQPRNL
jgi:hypothetical protein